MNSKQVAFNISFQTWISDKYFGDIFRKSILLYLKLKDPAFKIFHLYKDENLTYESYAVCIGACKFRRGSRKSKNYITFINLSNDKEYFNGWTVYDLESYANCSYSFDNYKDLGYIENPVKDYDKALLDFKNQFLENFK